jgi:hypothetical protein
MKRLLISLILCGCAYGQGSAIPVYVTPLWRGFLDETTARFQADADSTTFFQILTSGGTPVFTTDTTNKRVEIGSADGSDRISIFLTANDSLFRWSDGYLYLQTDEGTNTNTGVRIPGKGTGYGSLFIDDQDGAESLFLVASSGAGYIRTVGTSPSHLHLQNTAESNVKLFGSATEGETVELEIYGYRTADQVRSLQIGVGVDANNTSSFDGTDFYLFGGDVISDGTVLNERDSDPDKPAEGKTHIWMSDGTGYGDDGDVIIAATAGGTTKRGILWDFSAASTWGGETIQYNAETIQYNAENIAY